MKIQKIDYMDTKYQSSNIQCKGVSEWWEHVRNNILKEIMITIY